MNSETGERERDGETGEFLLPLELEFDDETGEPKNCDLSSNTKRTPFKIPKCATKVKKIYVPVRDRDMSPVLLILLPTLFIYPGFIMIIIALIEVSIHIWAHRKNKKLANTDVYYKSPMHIIASEFCAKCRDIKAMDKIEKLQEKRAHHLKSNYECVKRIVT